MAVTGARREFLPHRPDPGIELLDGRLAELGRSAGDEVLPELAGVLVTIRRSREVDEILGKAKQLKAPFPGRPGGE